jgi:hypothetical protein
MTITPVWKKRGQKMKLRKCLKLSQHDLKRALKSELQRAGYRPVTAPGYLYAKGTTPVLLVAHLDTVHKKLPTVINDNHGILSSPEGIGGDDRAGVYAILEMLDLRPHVLFCEDEEIGGIGAKRFASSSIEPDVDYIVELDRMGAYDAVFYDCDNAQFTEFVESYGFLEDFGSFSDISTIAPALGIAAVNLSVGYFNQHTSHEFIDTHVLDYTVTRVRLMLADAQRCRRPFEYIKTPRYYSRLYHPGSRSLFDDGGYGYDMEYDLADELSAGCVCPYCQSDILESFYFDETEYLGCKTCGWEYELLEDMSELIET